MLQAIIKSLLVSTSLRQLLTVGLLAPIAQLVTAQPGHFLVTHYGTDALDSCLVSPGQFHSVPTASDSYWQTVIPAAMRQSYAELGNLYAGCAWTPIAESVFAEYQHKGTDTRYEGMSFALRRQMASLAIAEVMEHRGRFLDDIVRGLRYFMGETWWGVPAHYPADHAEHDLQVVELFSAETAAMLAWTVYMLHDDLERRSPGISEAMRREVERRMLVPARTTDYSWKHVTTNWNPWVCSNWLACILLCERDRRNQLEAVGQVLRCLDTFYDAYPNDGGCDEGCMYWDRAAASLFDCLRLLGLATDGRLTMADQPKLGRMAAFVYKTYIGNRLFVNFADALPKQPLHPHIALPFGLYTGDAQLASFAMWRALYDNMFQSPTVLFLASGSIPSLSREILFLAQYDELKSIAPAEPLQRDSWLPDLQLFSARSTEKSIAGLFVAAKGGHNDESHNHNDVGNFIVYKDGTPLVIDIGVATYTSKTFSKQRYELFNCRSAYHNVPLVNGFEQHEGRQYCATGVEWSANDRQAELTLDIASAYPAEAAVEKWQRTVTLHRGAEVAVTEHYRLNRFISPSSLVLICGGDVRRTAPGTLVIGRGDTTCTLLYNENELTPTAEKIDYQDETVFRDMPVRDLFRLTLTIRSKAKRGKVSYFFK